jgi:hypothetical protein
MLRRLLRLGLILPAFAVFLACGGRTQDGPGGGPAVTVVTPKLPAPEAVDAAPPSFRSADDACAVADVNALEGSGGALTGVSVPEPDASMSGIGTDATTAEDGSPMQPSPLCPPTLPAAGTPCAASLACEYGTPGDVHNECTTVATCPRDGGVGLWEVTPPPAGCGSKPPSCPATWGGGACSVPGQRCDYPEGPCACIPCLLWSVGRAWPGLVCDVWPEMSESGCPANRPLLGTPCTTPDIFYCDYAPDYCVSGFGPAERCIGGFWMAVPRPVVRCEPIGGLCDVDAGASD